MRESRLRIGVSWRTVPSSVARRTAHALRRAVGRHQLGVLLLDREQLALELVELGVGDDRVVEDVVAVIVLRDLLAQLPEALLRFLLRHSVRSSP